MVGGRVFSGSGGQLVIVECFGGIVDVFFAVVCPVQLRSEGGYLCGILFRILV